MNTAWQAITGYINGFDPNMVKAVLMKLIRHVLTAGGGILITHGYLQNSGLEELIASAPFLAGLVMSVWDAYSVKQKVQNAEIAGRAEVGTKADKAVAVEALKETTKTP